VPPPQIAAARTCKYSVSGSGAVSYAELSAMRVLFDAELGCRYICLRLVGRRQGRRRYRHDCFTYSPDHVPCLAIRPVDDMLEDYL